MFSDGRQLLMYTGVAKETQPDGSTREIQTQCIAIGDGRDYEKYAENPVLTQKDLPEGGDKYNFRDPKIWREEDGTYACVIGNCTGDGDGRILLFRSEDGLCWKFSSILVENQKRFGKMWECPDFFTLDGKYVLLTSPQDMLPKGFEYHNGNGTLCLIGDLEKETGKFVEEANQSIDYGIDLMDAKLGYLPRPSAGKKMVWTNVLAKGTFHTGWTFNSATDKRAYGDAKRKGTL